MKIIVYHGTDCLFDEIDLSKSKQRRDFGIGFYTTTIAAQAESWAKSRKQRSHSDKSMVYVYEAELSDDLLIHEFEGLTIEWLEMVKQNRTLGGVQHNYDVVIGPVADDDTMLTVSRFIGGVYSAEEAITRLKYSKPNNQISFHTEKAIKFLKRIRSYYVD